MSKALKILLKEIAQVAKLVVEAGWGEAGSGNLSVNVSELIDDELTGFQLVNENVAVEEKHAGLAGQSLLVSLSGSRFRTLAKSPKKALCLLRFNKNASHYHLYAHEKATLSKIKPTSEIPTHLAVQEALLKRKHPAKVLLHVHMTEAIVLSHFKEMLDEEKLNQTLWSMLPEIAMFMPEGTGFVPYLQPGSIEIGNETAKKINTFDTVVWEKHGSLAVAESPEEAFDKLEMMAKAIHIYLECRKAGISPEGLSAKDIKALRK